MKKKKVVAIIATLDTKGEEVKYFKKKFQLKGLDVLIIDTHILEKNVSIKADITCETVAKAAGSSIEIIRKKDRSSALLEMAKGVPKIVRELYNNKKFDGILSICGETGAHLAAPGMEVLPIGVPKLMISCIFQGTSTFGSYVGTKDVLLMHSVIDILGVNEFSKKIFDTAIAAMTGMINENIDLEIKGNNLIAVTMFGNTTPVVMAVKNIVEKRGYEFVVFHPSGTGGRAMEKYIEKGFFKAVLDITTHDITDELFEGEHPGGPHRLEAAGRKGIPQIFVPGCMDFILAGSVNTLPDKYKNRKNYPYRSNTTLVKTTKKEMQKQAEIVALKLNKSTGSTVVVVPLRGMSMYNKEGYPLYDPEADRAFLSNLKKYLDSRIRIFEIDAHINDPVFAEKISSILIDLLEDV